MKTLTTLVILVSLFVTFTAQSQENFEQLFRAGINDANTYTEFYAEDIALAFTSALGSGWYNTAKPHKTLGFDLTAAINVASIPDEELLFNFNPDNYENLQLQEGDGVLPSIFGGDDDGANTLVIPASIVTLNPATGEQITYNTDIPFNAPDGLVDAEDLPFLGVPVPTLQLGIGLVKNTELKIRYASDFGLLEDGSINLFGIGALHDLKQWIPGLKQVPIDVSGFIGYTSFNLKYNFEYDEPSDSDFRYLDGEGTLKASSTTVQLVASKKIAVITPYLGIGYAINNSSLEAKGTVIYTEENGQEIEIQDPLDLNFDGGSTARINAGLRLKLGILTLHGEYAIQRYNTLTLGVGFSVR